MLVLIRPAKSDLKCVMKLSNGAVAAYEKATPGDKIYSAALLFLQLTPA